MVNTCKFEIYKFANWHFISTKLARNTSFAKKKSNIHNCSKGLWKYIKYT